MSLSKEEVIKTLETLKKEKKRQFSQSIDMIITLKDIDLKKTENHIDFFAILPHSKGKKSKICALIGPELKEEGKNCDKAILLDEFSQYTEKSKLKQLGTEFDYFIAQANIMAKVAQAFGKVLGPKGKMPNPKAGCVVPPKVALKPVYEKLQKTVRLKAKTALMIQTIVGKEDMKEEEVVENILNVYTQLIHHLPHEEQNIKEILLKLTMSKPIKVK